MKILVIGANGFIGANCVRYFSEKGIDVWQADVVVNECEDNYIVLEKKYTNFDNLFKNRQFDVCINASGSANVGFSFENPDIDYELNVYNVQKIAVAIHKYSPNCKLINFSSAAVYGNPKTLPINENSIKGPLSPYGMHKLQSEEILKYYYDYFKLRSCSLRVFSAYGEGLKKQLFWDLFQKYKKNEPIKLFGTGNESRDFIYIQDLLRAIELIIDKANFRGESINLSSGIETTINDAVKCFYTLLDDAISYEFNGTIRLGDPKNWKADITNLEKFGFQAKFNIEHGLQRYIDWIKELE